VLYDMIMAAGIFQRHKYWRAWKKWMEGTQHFCSYKLDITNEWLRKLL